MRREAVSGLQAARLSKGIAGMILDGFGSNGLRRHIMSVIPREVIEESVRMVLEGSPCTEKSNPLQQYQNIRNLNRFSERLPDGEPLMTRAQVDTYRMVSMGACDWDFQDVFPRSEWLVIQHVYHQSVAHYGAQDNYAKRRKDANSAIANKSLRQQVFTRHGEACLKCGDTNDLAIDHIVPVALGGTDDLDNLQVLCRSCNSSKGSNLEVHEESENPQ